MYTDMEQWTEIRRRVLVNKQSKRSVCLEFNLHWDTLTKMLERFDFTARPSVNKPMITELTRCAYIDKRENVLLVGNPELPT